MNENGVVWPFRFPKPEPSLQLSEALMLRFGSSAEVLKSQVDHGLWWVLAFASGDDDECYGLRLVPGAPLDRSPVVEANCFGATTIATALSTLVPFLCCRHWLLLAPSDRWTSNRSKWRKFESDLRRLDQILGGTGDLDGIRNAVNSDEIRDSKEPPETEPGSFARWFTWRADALRLADSSQANVQRLCTVVAAATRSAVSWPLPAGLGPWTEACLMAGFGGNRRNRRKDAELWFAWGVVRSPAAVDGSSITKSVYSSPCFTSPAYVAMAYETLLQRAPEIETDWKSDPWWEPTMALAQAGFEEYDGKAHFEAARKLDDAGRSVDALNALISANYWMVRRKPGPRFEVMEYALDLARRNGWEPLAYNIEVVQHAARQLAGK